MKKVSVLLCCLVIAGLTNYYSFSQEKTKKSATKTTKTASAKATSSTAKNNSSKAEIEQGKQLISKSDCLACHQLKVKAVGPAYTAVAEKYTATDANINRLSEKIIQGGSGVWGQIPMTPHPSIPVADARKMVKYILSLNSK